MYLTKNDLTIICNSNHYQSRQTLSLAKSLARKINVQDITNERISMSLFCFLMSQDHLSPKQLVNRADPYYQNNLKKTEYSVESWFYILKNRPSIFINPIVAYHDRVSICLTPNDILKIT